MHCVKRSQPNIYAALHNAGTLGGKCSKTLLCSNSHYLRGHIFFPSRITALKTNGFLIQVHLKCS